MARPGIARQAVVTEDTALLAKSGRIFWIAVSAGATGGAFQLNDSDDDGGTDIFDFTMAANTTEYFYFQPYISFDNGIFVDVPGSNLKINISYVA